MKLINALFVATNLLGLLSVGVLGDLTANYYYAVGLSALPPASFKEFTPYKTDSVPNLNYSNGEGNFATSGRSDEVGAWFFGVLFFPKAGTYQLHMTSDDGSKMYLDGDLVIDNDGLHGPTTVSTTITVSEDSLRKNFEVEYWENTGGATLIVEWTYDGVRAVIPPMAFDGPYEGWSPTKRCSVYPDPHFTSFGDTRYDFHDGCDVILVQNANVDVHMRLQRQGAFSVAQTVGVRIGEDIIEAKAQMPSSDWNYYFNDSTLSSPNAPSGPKPTTTVGGWALKVKSDELLITHPSTKGEIKIKRSSGIYGFSVVVQGGGASFDADFENTTGMCGQFTKEDPNLYDREDNINDEGYLKPQFGQDWQVQAPGGEDQQIMSDVTLDPIPSHFAYPNTCTGGLPPPTIEYPPSCEGILFRRDRNLREGEISNIKIRRTEETCDVCQDLGDPLLICNCEFDAMLTGCDTIEDIYNDDMLEFLLPPTLDEDIGSETDEPTPSPTESPTPSPTDSPTPSPTASPTASPTDSPTASPTPSPTASPTDVPSVLPSAMPSSVPGIGPTSGYQYSDTESASDEGTPVCDWDITLVEDLDIVKPAIAPGEYLMTTTYLIEDHHYDVELFEKDCLTEPTGSSILPVIFEDVTNTVDFVNKTNLVEMVFRYDQTLIQESSLWTSLKSGGYAEFCLKFNNYLSKPPMPKDDFFLKINFLEVVYKIDVDSLTDFNATIDIDRTNATDGTEGDPEFINYQEDLDAYQCDADYTEISAPPALVTGDFLSICVKTKPGSAFGIHSIKDLDVTQDGDKLFPYIDGFIDSPLTDSSCIMSNTTGAVCKSKMQLIASYFDDADPSDLFVSGTVKLDYVGRRLSVDVPISVSVPKNLVPTDKLGVEGIGAVEKVDRKLEAGESGFELSVELSGLKTEESGTSALSMGGLFSTALAFVAGAAGVFA